MVNARRNFRELVLSFEISMKQSFKICTTQSFLKGSFILSSFENIWFFCLCLIKNIRITFFFLLKIHNEKSNWSADYPADWKKKLIHLSIMVPFFTWIQPVGKGGYCRAIDNALSVTNCWSPELTLDLIDCSLQNKRLSEYQGEAFKRGSKTPWTQWISSQAVPPPRHHLMNAPLRRWWNFTCKEGDNLEQLFFSPPHRRTTILFQLRKYKNIPLDKAAKINKKINKVPLTVYIYDHSSWKKAKQKKRLWGINKTKQKRSMK